MKKQDFDTQRAQKIEGHFYASSFAEWRTGKNPEALIAAMQAGGLPFCLIWVPLPEDAEYTIEHYVPKVPGAFLIASWGFDKHERAAA